MVYVGAHIKFYIESMENGPLIRRGEVIKIKKGIFSEKYLVESNRMFEPTVARWVKKNKIIEINNLVLIDLHKEV